MVIAIEYMSDLLVGRLPVLDPNISGYRRSLGHQRAVTLPLVVDVLDRTEFSSPATLVSPISARQARSSPEMRMFSYTKLSATYCWKRSEIVLL